MPLDLKLVQAGVNGSLLGGTWPNPDYVDGEYNLVQRIFKNLHTTPGDDMFDPEWGSGLAVSLRGIPGQDTGAAKRAVSAVLKKCCDDVRQALTGSQPESNLLELRLESIEYDVDLAAWRCAVTVVTEANETPLSVQA